MPLRPCVVQLISGLMVGHGPTSCAPQSPGSLRLVLQIRRVPSFGHTRLVTCSFHYEADKCAPSLPWRTAMRIEYGSAEKEESALIKCNIMTPQLHRTMTDSMVGACVSLSRAVP
ncbi:unnamed protein product [Pleuronectes platessa]|uniref:Uncharacterized protein n=1 Tax=Pleuronectes platessa TaxID=8262 RepID=A0A9N7V478_PLEPL|nr:unnamed protein product [Pleuronectes platessa]